jgi:prevent-host-death family protein
MTSYSSTTARQNFFQIIKDVCLSHKPVHISSKNNKVVIMSEEDYNAIQETLYLLSIPNMRQSIKKGMDTPLEDCKDELDW